MSNSSLFKYIYIVFLLLTIIGYGQKKEITVLDEITKIPIENVNIFYPSTDEGTFTNSDGKAAFFIKKADLKIAHLNYNEMIISAEQLRDSIFLTPNAVELKEVIVNSFNLVKALQEVLDKYNQIYVNYPFEKECNFKEIVLVNDQLKRLILTKINWWSRSYFNKNNENDFKLRLGAIEYNKNLPVDIFVDSSEENTPSKSGFIETKSITNLIYLNSFLNSFLAFTDGYHTSIEESAANQLIVSYETEWKIIKGVNSRSFGKITFDKDSKAIVEFINEIEFKNKIVSKTTSISKKEYSYETKKSITKHNFYKNGDDKWSLKSFSSIVETVLEYNKKSNSVVFENEIFLLKETKMKKVLNDGLIDLTKPLYQNLPSNIVTTANSILLSEKEKDFTMKDK